jgi:arsenite methyltransferase
MSLLQSSKKADYGQDAPGVRLGMFAIGTVGLVISIASWLASIHWKSMPGAAVSATQLTGALATLYGVGMGTYMTWGSRVGKLRTRDRLLNQIGQQRPWSGDETVLDVGCGRGLMLIGAAHRLTDGKAIGIDLWRTEDQADNSLEATLLNANREGISDRVRIETGDARKLPLANGCADVVLSHWVVHNLEKPDDRNRALDEMWRVLRPGGVLAIADIGYVTEYVDHLRALGARPVEFFDGGIEARIMGALSVGTYRPQALICSRPTLNGSN